MLTNFSGFYKLPIDKRIEKVKKYANLSKEEIELLKSGGLKLGEANHMIENVIGLFSLPFAIATNFVINKKQYLIPMVIEEPSVVAAASKSAKLSLPEGFKAESSKPLMTGQIQIVDAKNNADRILLEHANEILKIANEKDPVLVKLGGGAEDIETMWIDTKRGKMLIVHLYVNVLDAMGANVVNTMLEAVAPVIEELTDGTSRLKIISNLSIKRIAKATCTWKADVIGKDAIEGILDAYEFACNNSYRCATHNKGIMNGIDALAIATGNDFRALEASAHAYSALKGYVPLTKYEKTEDGIKGSIEIPLAIATVGGATKSHPIANIARKILNIKTAKELSCIAASLGLAQNFAALYAMITEGIQKGHMKLHAYNIAKIAGAKEHEIDHVVKNMIKSNEISVSKAQQILKEIRN